MIELGEWTQALSIAPAVSLPYWRALCQRHADHLIENAAETSLVAPYLIAAGDTTAAIDYMVSRHDYADAATLATAQATGVLPPPSTEHSTPPSPNSSVVPNGAAAPRHVTGGGGASNDVIMVAEARARLLHEEGEPVLAACCFLAHGEITRAIGELLHTHQLDTALALALTLHEPSLQPLLLMLSARAERLHDFHLAIELLQRTRDPPSHLALLAARAAHAPAGPHGAPPPPDVFIMAQLPPAPSYRGLAETAQRGGHPAHLAEAVRCYLVCGDLRAAAEMALPELSQALGGGTCDLAAAHAMLEPLRQGPPLDGEGAIDTEARSALLAWSAYEGCLQAMWRGYTPVVVPLLRAVQQLVQGAGLALVNGMHAGSAHAPTGNDVDSLLVQVFAYLSRAGTEAGHAASLSQQLDEARAAGRLAEAHVAAYTAIVANGPPLEPPRVHARPILVRGSELASGGGGRASSLFTGHRISGPVHMLEDGVTCLALSEAVMWAKLHPFSPTHSGARLNPF